MATFVAHVHSMFSREIRSLKFLAIVGLGLVLTTAVQTEAQSIFRFGHLTWQPKPSISPNSVEFTLVMGFRRDAYPGTSGDGHPAVNDVFVENIGPTTIIFGDLTNSPVLSFKVLSIDIANNWMLAQALEPGSTTKMTVDHSYPGPLNAIFPWLAEVAGCCRNALEVNNPNKQYRLYTLIDLSKGNHPPVVTLTPIVQVQRGPASTFTIPATDADPNTRLNWRLATPDEASANSSFVQPGPPLAPSPLTIDSATGVAHWNTVGLPIGSLWSCQVVIEDNDSVMMTAPAKSVLKSAIVIGGPKTLIVEDFLISIVPGCAPPAFDPPSPICGSTIPGTVGIPMTFVIRSSVASEPADRVTLNVAGLPPGAIMAPPLPAIGNPVISTFSWIPPAPGITVLTFTAVDSCGLTSTCSLTLSVSPPNDPCANNKAPEFIVPPGGFSCGATLLPFAPGSFPVRVIDPDLGDRVTLSVAGLPPGATTTPPLPFTGNPVDIMFSFTPVVATTVVTFTAVDTCGHMAQCSYTLSPGACANNKPPEFVAPSPTCGSTLTAFQGVPFNFTVMVSDPDVGDHVTLNVASLPTGATLAPTLPLTGNPVTTTFSWTPTSLGVFPVSFTARDTCNHVRQCSYNIEVVEPTGDGLLGEYFIDDPILVLTRVDPTIDFDWGLGSPDPVVQNDWFSVTWTGFIKPRFSEFYKFTTVSDDGIRVWIDGSLVVSDWAEHSAHESSGSIQLKAGQKVPIMVMYFEWLGHASARLYWSSPSQPKEIIPQSQLFSSETPQAIQLASLKTKVVGKGKVAIAWATVTEKNSSGFEVQRSAGHPTDFLTVQVVPGHGTTAKPQQYRYTDEAAAGSDVLYYRIKQVDADGTEHYTDPVKVDVAAGLQEITAPREYTLSQNYPNPFNPETSIKFSVKDNVRATLRVYDMIGQEVATLFDDVAEAGQYYTVKFRTQNLASGMYFYRLTAGEFTQFKKMVVVK